MVILVLELDIEEESGCPFAACFSALGFVKEGA